MDHLRHFIEQARHVPVETVDGQMRSPYVFDPAVFHTQIGQGDDKGEVIAGVIDPNRVTAVFDNAIVVPSVFSDACVFRKELGLPEHQVLAETVGHHGLQVGVEEEFPYHVERHVPVDQRGVAQLIFLSCQRCQCILPPLQ